MDIFINNPPAQTVQIPTVQIPSVQLPVQGYGYAPYSQDHNDGDGIGFVLLFLLGAFLFLRWNRFGGRRRRWAMMGGGAGSKNEGPQATSQEGRDWKPPRMPWMRDSAAEIARERFARGEINADELGIILKGLDSE